MSQWEEWPEVVNVKDLDIDRGIKTLIDRVTFRKRQIYFDRTDVTRYPDVVHEGYMATLLNLLKFDEYPCSLDILEENSTYYWTQSYELRCVLDFAITSQGSIKSLCVMENRRNFEAFSSNDWREHELLGEMMVYCGVMHYLKLSYPFPVYGIRVVENCFTFYKAIVTEKYIDNLGKDSAETALIVERFPSPTHNTTNGLDICKRDDRRKIIETMCAIRNDLMNIES
ncbi:hypothetical protein Unana1_06756 [Umbelopsis nana]